MSFYEERMLWKCLRMRRSKCMHGAYICIIWMNRMVWNHSRKHMNYAMSVILGFKDKIYGYNMGCECTKHGNCLGDSYPMSTNYIYKHTIY